MNPLHFRSYSAPPNSPITPRTYDEKREDKPEKDVSSHSSDYYDSSSESDDDFKPAFIVSAPVKVPTPIVKPAPVKVNEVWQILHFGD
jgi:hypothetical protein